MAILNPNQTALLSVDNTKAFQDPQLNEMPVEGWEKAAQWTARAIEEVKQRGVEEIINTIEEHPIWHVSFASSFVWKVPFDGTPRQENMVTYEEVKNWTKDENYISWTAWFNLKELQAYLKEVWTQVLWPDHSVEWTEWVELIDPLEENMFKKKFIKWTEADREAYSAFENTWLDEYLKWQGIKNVLIWWLVTEVCINATARAAFSRGYQTFIMKDAIKALDEQNGRNYIESMLENDIEVYTIDDLKRMLE